LILNNIEETESIEEIDSNFINEIPNLLTNEEIMVKSKSNLVRPSTENLSRLEEIRRSNVFIRVFHKMEEGSMRGVVLLFLRLCIGVGILTLPFYMKIYGCLFGSVIFVLAAMVNYFMYKLLIEVGNETGIQDYLILTKRYTSTFIQKLFKFTYLFDLISSVIFYMILVYNIFEYLLCFFNLIPDDWFQDKTNFTLKTYDPKVIILRTVYNFLSFFLLLPFMFKKDLGSLRSISSYYLLMLSVLCIYIFIEMGFFRANLHKRETFHVDYIITTPSGEWVESFFGIMLAYYAQQYFFSIRNELMHPTTKRLKKTTYLTILFLCIISLLIGIFEFNVFWSDDD